MKDLRFYKEKKKWYADIPNWTGMKAQLQMVAGADILLDYLAGEKDEVTLTFSETNFDGAQCLNMIEEIKGMKFSKTGRLLSFNAGADYVQTNFRNTDADLDVWLCNVTKHVFGYFPKRIFYSITNN